MNQRTLKYAVALASALTIAGSAYAQAVSAEPQTDKSTPATATSTEIEDTIILTPFEVSSSKDVGYSASTTLAGNRLNTELRDVGNSISVVTEQFMKDVGATDNKTLLQYTAGTEVGSIQGNFTGGQIGQKADESGTFASPNQNTRVRGLTSADNTRDFFMSDIPWDGYNIERVDLSRGPNSIIYGQGSPGGIINNSTKQAKFKNSGETTQRVDNNGSFRATMDINYQIRKGELAVRVMGVTNKERYKQKPAYEDGDRIYGALRYDPKFLNSHGVSTSIKINAERGDISANRPRSITPMDFVSPWFKMGTTNVDANGNIVATGGTAYNNLNKQFFDPYMVQDQYTGIPGRGQAQTQVATFASSSATTATNQANPYYIPEIGPFAQSFGGPLMVFDGSSSAMQKFWLPSNVTTNGIGANGNIDGGIGGIPYGAQVGILEYMQLASRLKLKYHASGVYKDVYLSDPSIFDFYNNLLDGPNKSEWNRFNTTNVNINQTYFNNMLGWEFAYDSQHYSQGQLSLLTDFRQAIYVDMMGTLLDGSINPNRGRAFVSDGPQYGNSRYTNDRESKRFTAFYIMDAEKYGKNILTKVIGKHTVTGMFANDKAKSENISFMRWRMNSDFMSYTGKTSATDLQNQLNPITYLGENLQSRTSASGANIPRIQSKLDINANSIYAFNSTWKATSVDPAATWLNTRYDPRITASYNSTQSENPANYVGYSQVPATFISAEDGYEDEMTTGATLKKSEVTSRALVWQGQLWKKLLIGNFGIRNDISRGWAAAAERNTQTGGNQLVDWEKINPNTGLKYYQLSDKENTRLQVTSQSWSIVAHLSELLPEKFPLRISVMYSKSENFSPESARWDIYGNALEAPKGKTWDRAIAFSTKDDKYSLKIGQFETRAKNKSVSGGIAGNTWFLSALESWGGNHADKFQYDIYDIAKPTATNPANSGWAYNYYGDADNKSAEYEAADVAAWRQHQKNVPTAFYEAFNMKPSVIGGMNASGYKYGTVSFTEDAISKGYEIELTANPTKSLRLSANATRVEASRSNVGGDAFLDFVSIVEKDLAPVAGGRSAGDLRIWGGGSGNTTIRQQWANNIGNTVALNKLLEGQSNPEIRKWRFNLVANYSFYSGLLKGFGLGAGYRWQDRVLIGYPVIGPNTTAATYDLDNPYMGPSEANIDTWLSYGRKITKGIDWSIQFNVRNLTAGNELIPLNTQPDGTPAAYRIAPPRVFTLTNTFRF